MNLFAAYRAYIKNNPQGYWFKRKVYGWGWTPARWQGWVVMAGYLAVIIGLVLFNSHQSDPEPLLWSFVVPFVLATVVVVLISYWKGEPPCWQWGLSKEEDDDVA